MRHLKSWTVPPRRLPRRRRGRPNQISGGESTELKNELLRVRLLLDGSTRLWGRINCCEMERGHWESKEWPSRRGMKELWRAGLGIGLRFRFQVRLPKRGRLLSWGGEWEQWLPLVSTKRYPLEPNHRSIENWKNIIQKYFTTFFNVCAKITLIFGKLDKNFRLLHQIKLEAFQ